MIDPVLLVKAYHAALELRDLARVSEFFSEHATYVSNGLGALQGRAHIMASMQSYFATHPDHTAVDESIECVSELVAKSVWRLEAGRVSRRGIEVITFDEAGLILKVEVHDA